MKLPPIAIIIGTIVLIAATFFYGVDYGKNKERSKYETAANKAVKAAQVKHMNQLKDKDKTIKGLNNELQNQLLVVRNSKDECMHTDVDDDIKLLLQADRNNNN